MSARYVPTASSSTSVLCFPALALFRFELGAVPGEELAQLLAPGLRLGEHLRLVAKVRDERVQCHQIVPPERIRDLSCAKAVHSERLEHMAARAQRRFEGLALDDLHAARAQLDVVRHVSRARDD